MLRFSLQKLRLIILKPSKGGKFCVWVLFAASVKRSKVLLAHFVSRSSILQELIKMGLSTCNTIARTSGEIPEVLSGNGKETGKVSLMKNMQPV